MKTFFKQILNAIPDPVIVVDSHGVIVEANMQVKVLLGYSPQDLLKQPFEILLPDSYREAHRQNFDAVLATPLPRQMGERHKLSARHKDGSYLPVDVSLSPFKLEEGIRIMAVGRTSPKEKRWKKPCSPVRRIPAPSLGTPPRWHLLPNSTLHDKV